MPAALGSFTWTQQPPASPYRQAVALGATVTAYDIYGNVKTDYTGAAAAGATLSGLRNFARAAWRSSYRTAGSNRSVLRVTRSWATGVGTLTGVIDKDAETTALTITNTSPSVIQASSSFTVNAGVAGRAPVHGAADRSGAERSHPRHDVSDHPGEGAGDRPVREPGVERERQGGDRREPAAQAPHLAARRPRATDSTGTATFDNLTINKVGVGYTLVATLAARRHPPQRKRASGSRSRSRSAPAPAVRAPAKQPSRTSRRSTSTPPGRRRPTRSGSLWRRRRSRAGCAPDSRTRSPRG